MPKHQIENLVFAGGGVKVVAYAGVLKALEETNTMTKVQKIAGTSGGAIAALCISLGYNAEEMKAKLLDLDFNAFTDRVSRWRFIWHLLSHFGFNSGVYFDKFLKSLLADKGFTEETSFKTLYEKTGQSLFILATDLNRQFVRIFSPEHTPEMSVVTAVHASGALPIYFYPVQDQELYVDGGVIDNYPIELFDQTPLCKYITQEKHSVVRKNKHSLGFIALNPKVLKAYQEGNTPEPFMKPSAGFSSFLEALLNILLTSQDYKAFLERDRTVFINDQSISTIHFSISQEEKLRLMQAGYEATMGFLQDGTNFKNFI